MDVVAAKLQYVGQRLHVVRIVIDDQDAKLGVRRAQRMEGERASLARHFGAEEQRQSDDELAPTAGAGAQGFHLAAVQIDQALYESEPESQAVHRVTARGVHAHERLEN